LKNKGKNVIIASAIAFGVGIAAFNPISINASTNVVIASVEWVQSQLNPINSKISQLESKINSQQQEINNLKLQIANGTVTQTPSLPSTIYISSTTATIHSGATKSYRIVATSNKGTALKVIDTHQSTSGLWYRVQVSTSVAGWVFSGDASTTAVSKPTSVVTTASVNIRSGATVGYKVVKTVPNGTTLKYIQSFTNSSGETWFNVEISGTRGWMVSNLGEVK
jgi:uncharacterized protein YgiM (DUF1202 family)